MAFIARFGLRFNDIRSADCSSAEAVGDFVYLTDNISGRDQVRWADPKDYSKLPAVGAIVFEYAKDPNFGRAARAGAGAYAGFVVGSILKVVLAFVLLGVVALRFAFH